MAPLLADIIIYNGLGDGTFIEPFAGGAGAALQILFDEYVYDVVLNDLDPRIYAFWRAVINQTEALISRVEKARITMKEWHRCQEVYSSAPSRHNQLDLAFAVFFLNRCNRSGILMGGGPIGGYHQSGKWQLDARFNKNALIERIRRVAAYRERITVRRMDVRDLLRDPTFNVEETLVYLDPPYYDKGQRLYLNAFDHDDHQALADLLLDDPPFHWVLTYDNVPEIRSLYSSHAPMPFRLSYSAYKRSEGKELLVIDPRLSVPDELYQSNHRPGRLMFEV